ncbi:unnamed protein product [Nippostrongylus brasiliensis]|uniref:Protein PXR1-like n=1 Tax=Nippostrongylus brasiliensis TaxID=27835 RepID=A0A0N4XG46_NIPBR|nr:unnamed protein product [Nippostrongylus brasiliensis]
MILISHIQPTVGLILLKHAAMTCLLSAQLSDLIFNANIYMPEATIIRLTAIFLVGTVVLGIVAQCHGKWSQGKDRKLKTPKGSNNSKSLTKSKSESDREKKNEKKKEESKQKSEERKKTKTKSGEGWWKKKADKKSDDEKKRKKKKSEDEKRKKKKTETDEDKSSSEKEERKRSQEKNKKKKKRKGTDVNKYYKSNVLDHLDDLNKKDEVDVDPMNELNDCNTLITI